MIRFVIVLLVLAAVLYGLFWAIDRRSSGGATPARRLPSGPTGPDDDEAFLRDLDLDRRRQPPPSQESRPHDHPE